VAGQIDLAAPHYRAFISYSHRDKVAAAWLHRTLETFSVPANLVGRETPIGIVPARLTPIFRDRDELPASGDLGQELKAALGRAMFLIVVCSPAAARSRWVNEEIHTFRRLHGDGRVLALVVDGEPNAPQSRADAECFPPALLQELVPDKDRGDARVEPIAADLRRQGDGRRLAKLKLIAALTGLGLDELARREAQRRARRLTIVAAAAVVGMMFAIGLALYANARRIEANEQRLIAEREAATARTASTFLVDTFTIANPASENPRTITALTILDRGAERIERELASQPAVQTRLTTTVARAYNNLGLYERAVRSITGNGKLDRLRGLDGAEALNTLAVAYFEQGQFDTALSVKSHAETLLSPSAKNAAVRAESALIEARIRAAQQQVPLALSVRPRTRVVPPITVRQLGKTCRRASEQGTTPLGGCPVRQSRSGTHRSTQHRPQSARRASSLDGSGLVCASAERFPPRRLLEGSSENGPMDCYRTPPARSRKPDSCAYSHDVWTDFARTRPS
jgi:tetratricopeptide (TPR) repeat protein